MGRIIAIDYGTKRIGLAVTDPGQVFAFPLETISSAGFDKFIEDYLKTNEVESFVVGYPVQMNNMPSDSVRYINPFIKKLKNKYPEMHIHLADERFTSQMALRTMITGGLKKKDRQNKSIKDKISASIMLKSFLDSRNIIKEK
jgi:putative Holliday junction resolvase